MDSLMQYVGLIFLWYRVVFLASKISVIAIIMVVCSTSSVLAVNVREFLKSNYFGMVQYVYNSDRQKIGSGIPVQLIDNKNEYIENGIKAYKLLEKRKGATLRNIEEIVKFL